MIENMLPIARHKVVLEDAELTLIARSLLGRFNDDQGRRAFEEAFADYLGVEHVFAFDSARSALAVGLKALNLNLGDTVVLPEYCFYSLVKVVEALGLRSVFAPVRPDTLAIDPDKLEKYLENAAALILIHPFGQLAEVETIRRICRAKNVLLIEDPSQSTGAGYKGNKAGSFGVFSTFSLVSGKNLQTFGGGLLAVKREDLAQRVRTVYANTQRPFAKDSRKRISKGLLDWLLTTRLGFSGLAYPLFRSLDGINRDLLDNLFVEKQADFKIPDRYCRLSNIQGALGCLGLRELDRRNRMRANNALRLIERLEDLDNISTQKFRKDATNTFNAVAVQVADARGLAQKLLRRGVDTRMDYMDWFGPSAGKPLQILYLPNHPGMTFDQVDRVADCVICS
jgi:dTDP-4-amino-4,6-dideoxygalactose transaminase